MKYSAFEKNNKLYDKYLYINPNAPKEERIKVPKDQFLKGIKKSFGSAENVTAEMINDGITAHFPIESVYGMKPLTEPDEKTREDRRELTEKLHTIYAEKFAENKYAEQPSDSLGIRYIHELYLSTENTTEAKRANEEIYGKIVSPKGSEKDVIRYHYEILKKFEGFRPDELIGKNFSDKELVDNFEAIHYCSQTTLQFQNIRTYLQQNDIKPTDDEDRKRLDEIERIMDKYEYCNFMLNLYDIRTGYIDNPFYELIDPKSEDFFKLSQAEKKYQGFDLAEIAGDNDIERADGASSFDEYLSIREEMREYAPVADIHAVVDTFKKAGIAPEDLQFRKISGGVVSEIKPYEKRACEGALDNDTDARVEIFCKDQPDKKMTVFASSNGELAAVIYGKNAPAPERPVRPSWGKRFLHWMSNKNYKNEFTEYYRKKAAFDAYNNVAANKARWEDGDKAKLTTGSELKDKMNEKILDKLNDLPDRTEKGVAFRKNIVNMIAEEKDPETADKLRKYVSVMSQTSLNRLQKYSVANDSFNIKENIYSAIGKADSFKAEDNAPALGMEEKTAQKDLPQMNL